MTEYTRKNPFEVELAGATIRVWREQEGCIGSSSWTEPVVLEPRDVAAVLALLEAERGNKDEQWAWLDEAQTKARKGGWVGYAERGNPHVIHDDFKRWALYDNKASRSMTPWHVEGRAALDSFMAWLVDNVFVQQEIPEKGEWGEFTFRDGRVEIAEVTAVGVRPSWVMLHLTGNAQGFIDTKPNESESKDDIISWRRVEPPQPDEPTEFGSQVAVNEYRFLRSPGASVAGRDWVSETGVWTTWYSICSRGHVEVIK